MDTESPAGWPTRSWSVYTSNAVISTRVELHRVPAAVDDSNRITYFRGGPDIAPEGSPGRRQLTTTVHCVGTPQPSGYGPMRAYAADLRPPAFIHGSPSTVVDPGRHDSPPYCPSPTTPSQRLEIPRLPS